MLNVEIPPQNGNIQESSNYQNLIDYSEKI